MAGETKDVSYTGAFISCREPLKPNEVLEMSISVSLLSPRVQAIAEVVWSNPSSSDEEIKPRGMGVRFTKVETTDHEMISALVEDHLEITDLDRPGEDGPKSAWGGPHCLRWHWYGSSVY
jgi:Tfp pilus assembly protein PilZ